MSKLGARVWLLAALVGASAAHAGERYLVDANRSHVRFSVPYVFMILGQVQGEFPDFVAVAEVDAVQPEHSTIVVALRTSSIDTDFEARDLDLRGPAFFECDRFPVATLHSRRIERTADGYRLVGELELKGTSGELVIPFQLQRQADGLRIVGETSLDRKAFGIDWQGTLNTDDFLVADEVTLSIDLALRRDSGGAVPEAVEGRLVGQYATAEGAVTAEVLSLSGALAVKFTGQRLSTLVREPDGTFRVVGTAPSFELRFDDREGPARAFTLSRGQHGAVTFQRREASP